jgi:carbonic anhydrase
MEISFEQYVADQLAKDLAVQKKPSVLLLTCMDYRYAHRIIDVMDRANLRRKYDMFVLAGAAAGANKYKTWRRALVEHIRTARSIDHPIDRLMILEHRDCGAYKAFFGLEWSKVKPPVEQARHAKEVIKLITDLKREFEDEIPNLKFDSFLLTRDEDDALTVEIPHP